MKKKKNIYIIFILLIIISVIIFVLVFCSIRTISNQYLSVRYNISNDAMVKPILFLETGIGGEDYDNLSYLIDTTELTKVEKYKRSYLKTFPETALNNNMFENSDPTVKYGQLMAYYKKFDGQIYLFDNLKLSLQNNLPVKYTIVYNGNTAIINPSQDEQFINLLYFNDNPYVFCFDTISKQNGHFEDVVIYQFTDELQLITQNRIHLPNIGITSLELVNKSFAVYQRSIIFSVYKENRYYLAKYNMDTNNIELQLKYYQPICQIAGTDYIYSVGTKGNIFVLEVLSANHQVDYIESTYPKSLSVDFGVRKCYMYYYENVLYGSATTKKGNTILFSYDVNEKKWLNWWEVECYSEYQQMDYKYVIFKDSLNYDLLPFCINMKYD